MTRPHRTEDQIRRRLLDGDEMLTTGEVAAVLRVHPRTPAKWALAGLVPDLPDGSPGVIRTSAPRQGHYRWRASVVRDLLAGRLQIQEASDGRDG